MKKLSNLSKSLIIVVALFILAGGIILLANPFSKNEDTDASNDFVFSVNTVSYRAGGCEEVDSGSTSRVGSSLFTVYWYEDEGNTSKNFDSTLYYNGTSTGGGCSSLSDISSFYYHYDKWASNVRRHGRIKITSSYPSWWRCHGVYDSADAAGSPVNDNTVYYKWDSNAPTTTAPSSSNKATKTMSGICYVIYRWYYRLSFDVNGGSGIPSNQYFYSGLDGVSITSTTPTRSGYTFKGWSRSSTATSATYSSGDTFKDQEGDDDHVITLYAVWEANSYTVTLDKQNGSGGDDSKTATYGSSMPGISVPSRAGYTFGGYYTGTYGSGTKYYNSDGTSAKNWNKSSDATLYAYWIPNVYKIDVNIMSPIGVQDYASGTMTYYNSYTGNTYNSKTDQPEDNLQFGGNIQISNISPSTGMKVSSVSSSRGKGTITESGGTYTYTLNVGGDETSDWYDEIIIRMEWKTYNIELRQEGGSGGTTSITATYNSPMPSITVPTRYGYEFQGYYWSTGGSGDQYYDSNGGSLKDWTYDGATWLAAYWKVKNFNIVYNSNDGTGRSTSEGANFGASVKLKSSSTFTRTGYTFVGWSKNSSASSPEYNAGSSYVMITEEDGVNLYAIWRNNKYYVRYNANASGRGVDGNCISSDPVSGTMSNSTHYYNISSNLSNNAFTRRGYTFQGWSTDYNATGATYGNNASINNLTTTDNATVDMYAIWKRNSYTILFNANGGNGTTSSLTMLYNNGNYNLPKCGYSRPGYVFEGWTTNSNGTGSIYKDCATVSSYDYVSNVTLYAKWKATWMADVMDRTEPLKGNGTQTNPYKIETANDLAYLSKLVQENSPKAVGWFEQIAPIDLSGKIWLPIGGNYLGNGGESSSFNGFYNGRGFAIIGLETYSQTDASGNYLYSSVGLFGRTNGAYLKDINLFNAKIYGKSNVGALVGENTVRNLTMYGCFARALVNGLSNVGGLVGNDSVGSRISNCGFAGNVDGGSIIVGKMSGGIIENCYAEVDGNIKFCGSEEVMLDACVFETSEGKYYYSDKTKVNGINFDGWTTYQGKPLPKGLTWIGGVSDNGATLDGYTLLD